MEGTAVNDGIFDIEGILDGKFVTELDGEGLGSGEFSLVGASVAFDGIIDGIGVGSGDSVGPTDGARETDGTPDVLIVGAVDCDGLGPGSIGIIPFGDVEGASELVDDTDGGERFGFADGAGDGPGDSVGVADGVVGAGDAVGFPKIGLGVADQ